MKSKLQYLGAIFVIFTVMAFIMTWAGAPLWGTLIANLVLATSLPSPWSA